MEISRPKILFLSALIVSVALGSLIGIAVLLFGSFGELEVKVLLTTLTVTVTSILGLACGAYLESGRGWAIPVAGIVTAIASCGLWIFLVWHGTVYVKFYAQSLMSLTLFAALCAHISLLSLAVLDRRFIWARYAFITADAAMTAYLLFLIWNDKYIDNEITPRVVGILAILVAALTLAIPIFHKWSSYNVVDDIDTEIAKLRARIEELESRKLAVGNAIKTK